MNSEKENPRNFTINDKNGGLKNTIKAKLKNLTSSLEQGWRASLVSINVAHLYVCLYPINVKTAELFIPKY